jgi:hypothetical protein
MTDKNRKTESTEDKSAGSIKSVSVAYEFKLARALSSDSYDPKAIDDWYKDQRKASFAFAKELVVE